MSNSNIGHPDPPGPESLLGKDYFLTVNDNGDYTSEPINESDRQKYIEGKFSPENMESFRILMRKINDSMNLRYSKSIDGHTKMLCEIDYETLEEIKKRLKFSHGLIYTK